MPPPPGLGPEARYEAREAISLAFITAVQRLPPRQRAVLIPRDVLGFAASEAARILGSTEESVTSALKRARATLRHGLPAAAQPPPPPGSAGEKELIERLSRAYEAGGVDAIIALFTEDAWLTMPPVQLEYQGRDLIGRFLATTAFRDRRTCRLVPARPMASSPSAPTCGNQVPAAPRRTGRPVSTLPTDRQTGRKNMAASGDYTRQIRIDADPEKVFGALTSVAEFASWWAPATGSAAAAGDLRVTFDGIEDPLMLRVRQATPASTVAWDVEACVFLPDWVGTSPAFTLTRSAAGGCDVEFRHEGLSPRLECFDMCRAGWDQYLPSLRDYLETGTGHPYTLARLG